MGREGVRAALERLDDDDVRERIGGGDLSDLSDLTLDEAEQELVRGAAVDYPEVVGFAFSVFGAGVNVQSSHKYEVPTIANKWNVGPGYLSALKYSG
jgi:hypothetical protein